MERFQTLLEFGIWITSPFTNWEFLSGLVLGLLVNFFYDQIKTLAVALAKRRWFLSVSGLVFMFLPPAIYGAFSAWRYVTDAYQSETSPYLDESSQQWVLGRWWWPNALWDGATWKHFILGFLAFLVGWIVLVNVMVGVVRFLRRI